MLHVHPDERPSADLLLNDKFFNDEFPAPCSPSQLFQASKINNIIPTDMFGEEKNSPYILNELAIRNKRSK
jgi:hypothetical protein